MGFIDQKPDTKAAVFSINHYAIRYGKTIMLCCNFYLQFHFFNQKLSVTLSSKTVSIHRRAAHATEQSLVPVNRRSNLVGHKIDVILKVLFNILNDAHGNLAHNYCAVYMLHLTYLG